MTITPYQFFYDGQQRRFLEQIIRAFSGFSYQTGMVNGQPPQTKLVPCRMSLSNMNVAGIRANSSENVLNEVPQITIWQTGLRGRLADLQNTAFTDSLQVFERNIDGTKYGPNRGNAYNVERIMPLPFNMEVQVDIWTSNLDQKYQLSEQILLAMWPEFQIQNSDNALDWSAVTVCFLDDDIAWSSRSVPIGTTDEADIMTIKLRLPIWLTAPAKVRKMVRINEVIANVGDRVIDVVDGSSTIGTLYGRTIVTPGNFCVSVDGNIITLLGAKGDETLPNGAMPSWSDLITQYGLFTPTVSELTLFLTSDIEGAFVSGTLEYGSAPNQLVWTLDTDTLPASTLIAVNAVIDPHKTYPGQILPAATEGDRYLLVNDIGNSVAWGSSFSANVNDIIQYDGTSWGIDFDSTVIATQQYIQNTYTGRQLRWNGEAWLMSIDTFYGPGLWRFAL